MTTTRVIRYTTRPEAAEENAGLIREVFAELAIDTPDGLDYQAYRLDDGVSFIHIVTVDESDNPLGRSAAFARFQQGISERCAEGPFPSQATLVGSYVLKG